eukprot:TRINITY_DN24646_c0_g1_i1.p1 TRINITY_DN24646_c0_g1~~TRINITY_DN24646_c0_g1_i1.p1  ORF type:complete len:112 (-),score=17.19 TRINITY_DN24646_c0_g1_i1:4-339(-)
MPIQIESLDDSDIADLANHYGPIISDSLPEVVHELLKDQVSDWKKKVHENQEWKEIADVVKIMDKVPDYMFLVKKLLQILATLPVSNATSERNFSALKRIKTWLRATMEQG